MTTLCTTVLLGERLHEGGDEGGLGDLEDLRAGPGGRALVLHRRTRAGAAGALRGDQSGDREASDSC